MLRCSLCYFGNRFDGVNLPLLNFETSLLSIANEKMFHPFAPLNAIMRNRLSLCDVWEIISFRADIHRRIGRRL